MTFICLQRRSISTTAPNRSYESFKILILFLIFVRSLCVFVSEKHISPMQSRQKRMLVIVRTLTVKLFLLKYMAVSSFELVLLAFTDEVTDVRSAKSSA